MSNVKFTDRNGCTWVLSDYRVTADERQPVPLNDFSADCRAFESPETGTVLVYTFGQVSYRTTEPNVLEGQLLFAKPLRRSRPKSEQSGDQAQMS